MPTFLEEFGEGRKIDVMFSLSHSLIADKLDGVKISGFQMDKNGNFRFIINLAAQILVEKKDRRREWDEGRSAYLSLQAKGKFVIKNNAAEGRTVTIMPKNLEVTNLKILKADGEE